MIKRVLGVAAATALALTGLAAPASAGGATTLAGDCYTAVTYPLGFMVDTSSDYVLTPTLYGSTHCNDVNIHTTSSAFRACVIRTYQGQSDCSSYTSVGTSWVVPSGGSGIPNGAAFKVKLLGGPVGRPIYGTIAY
ncbi:hypothetical protein QEZ54_24000 [Catellatospora sp. KI3]|uniref:hypothetical protein n=1 Tax=Catellatospora sp. KI3 TaxID=3041620 RepID=UPI0024822879|nr:hypothetical protein [Catellatospora sp. KI3]MDI1464053.1 hypothetical protein [Catellatospora sp. KI3]